MHIMVCTDIYICMYVCMYVYIHISKHIYTHTHTEEAVYISPVQVTNDVLGRPAVVLATMKDVSRERGKKPRPRAAAELRC